MVFDALADGAVLGCGSGHVVEVYVDPLIVTHF